MIPDWQTHCVYVSHLLPQCHVKLWKGLEAALKANGIKARRLRGTKDLWLRDFMPIQIDPSRFVKFRYDPDYLKGYEELITDESVCRSIPHLRECLPSSIKLDGGNVVAATDKVIMTEKVFKENPRFRPQNLRNALQRLFHAECIYVPREPHDPIGHADGLVRFLDDATVVVNDYSAVDKAYGRRLRNALKKHRLHCEEVPYFVSGEGPDGMPAAIGCYVNYLRTAGLVVVPTFGIKEDDRAVRRLEELFRGLTVVPLRCEDLAAKGGVLNCCTWGLQTPSRFAHADEMKKSRTLTHL